jgi:hypothetical protein
MLYAKSGNVNSSENEKKKHAVMKFPLAEG